VASAAVKDELVIESRKSQRSQFSNTEFNDQDRCMPRRELLTAAQREALLAFPDEEENLLQHYVLSVRDLAAVRQHRGDHNRLGFAVQLCYLRYPGRVLAENETPPAALLGMVAAQLQVQSALWDEYAQRDETRREHLIELQQLYGVVSPNRRKFRRARFQAFVT
jgi:TnpA family transposase